MRVSFYTTWNDACGIADYSRFVKDALERTGVDVEIVPVPEKKDHAEFVKIGRSLNAADLTHIQYDYSFFSDAHDDFLFIFSAVRHLSVLLKQINKTKIITVHELEIPLGNGVRPFILRMIQRQVYRKVDYFIVHTTALKNKLLTQGVSSEKIAVIPHPIPQLSARLTGDIHSFKEKLALENKKVVTIFGFIGARKGYEIALDAIKDIEDCILLIAGGPHPKDTSGYYRKLVQAIDDRQLCNRVKILGYLSVDDVYKAISAADIVLAPFQSASGSGSLSIATAFHKPIIASDIDPMKELKETGLGIELFNKGDGSALKRAIVRLLSNRDELQRLIEINKHYSEQYSYDNFSLILYRLYKKYSN